MANPSAGWYPDPSGDATKLRWWDGNQWTDNYTNAVTQPQPAAQPAAQPAQFQQTAQPVQQPAAQPTQAAGYQQPYQQAGYQQPYQQTAAAQPYNASSSDSTLRLIAFILFCISCGSALISGFSFLPIIGFIPLAWCIPMTIMSWGIYKGTRANTTAFGVLSLIFVNLIGGILLLVSKKDR